MRLRLDFKCWFYKAQSHLYDRERCPCSQPAVGSVCWRAYSPTILTPLLFLLLSSICRKLADIINYMLPLYVTSFSPQKLWIPAPSWWWQVSALTEPGSAGEFLLLQADVSVHCHCILVTAVCVAATKLQTSLCQLQFVNQKFSC